MRLMGRNDVVLMIGLTIALFVIFSGPVSHFLDYVREIETTRGLHLVPVAPRAGTGHLAQRAERDCQVRLAAHLTQKVDGALDRFAGSLQILLHEVSLR